MFRGGFRGKQAALQGACARGGGQSTRRRDCVTCPSSRVRSYGWMVRCGARCEEGAVVGDVHSPRGWALVCGKVRQGWIRRLGLQWAAE